MPSQGPDSAVEAPPKGRPARWWRRAVGGLVALAVVFLGAKVGFRLWVDQQLPADAPRIAVSVDDSWLEQLGLSQSTYEQVLARAGARLVEIEPDSAAPDEAGELLDALEAEGLLLTGGGDVDPELYGGNPKLGLEVDKERDALELALIEAARERQLPILGICRGAQLLNVAFGGTLRSLREDDALEKAHFGWSGHAVEVENGSSLATYLGTAQLENVESFHGQAVDRVGDGLRAVAKAADGVVEAVESQDAWIVGVQWHPELVLDDPEQQRLVEAFVEAARRERAAPD